MIGNDIVDLEAAAIESNWKRPGFLQKIFTENEQELIHEAEQPSRQLWHLWSMKEAAYKAHQRKTKAGRTFNPLAIKCITVSVEGSIASGTVNIGQNLYYLRSQFGSTYVHSIATPSVKDNYISNIFPTSANLKDLLIKKISEVKKISVEKISLEKDPHSVPYINYNGKPMNWPFSLSHHGNFASYSLALMNY